MTTHFSITHEEVPIQVNKCKFSFNEKVAHEYNVQVYKSKLIKKKILFQRIILLDDILYIFEHMHINRFNIFTLMY